jgi:hypothetical protein
MYRVHCNPYIAVLLIRITFNILFGLFYIYSQCTVNYEYISSLFPNEDSIFEYMIGDSFETYFGFENDNSYLGYWNSYLTMASSDYMNEGSYSSSYQDRINFYSSNNPDRDLGGLNGSQANTNGTSSHTNGTSSHTNGTSSHTNGTSSHTNGTSSQANTNGLIPHGNRYREAITPPSEMPRHRINHISDYDR